MKKAVKLLVAGAVCSVPSALMFAQRGAEEGISPSPLVVIANEPAPKLFVEAPLSEPLSRGVALVPYRVEHLRILPLLTPLNATYKGGKPKCNGCPGTLTH
jgi:hypothetical protein